MSGLCFFAYSMPSGANPTPVCTIGMNLTHGFFRSQVKTPFKKTEKKFKVQKGLNLSSVDILQPFLHSLIILLDDSHK